MRDIYDIATLNAKRAREAFRKEQGYEFKNWPFVPKTLTSEELEKVTRIFNKHYPDLLKAFSVLSVQAQKISDAFLTISMGNVLANSKKEMEEYCLNDIDWSEAINLENININKGDRRYIPLEKGTYDYPSRTRHISNGEEKDGE